MKVSDAAKDPAGTHVISMTVDAFRTAEQVARRIGIREGIEMAAKVAETCSLHHMQDARDSCAQAIRALVGEGE